MSKQNGISIKQAAQWSGVTVRTLHYYDQIGLLKPQVVGENGYRYYSQENLQTLQQKEQKRGEEEGKEMQQQMEEIFERAAQLRKTDPAALPAQQLVEAWKAHITQYHYECTNEILAGLAQMYRYDERFMANLDRYGKGTACFLAEAIDCYWKEKSGC